MPRLEQRKIVFSKTAREMGSVWSKERKVTSKNDTFPITYRSEDGHKVILCLEPDDLVLVLRKAESSNVCG